MKKLLVAIAVFSLFCIPAFAQDTPAFEIFGAYSLFHANSNDDLESDAMTLHGFLAAVEGNVHRNIGIVGEFGFYQKTERWEEYELTGDCRWRLVPILFGPRFSYRSDNVRVFGHYLLGMVRSSYLDKDDEGYVWDDYSDTNFGQAIGGGIDIVLTDLISIRPAQFDFMSVKVSDSEGEYSVDTWQHGFRYSAGIVITPGR